VTTPEEEAEFKRLAEEGADIGQLGDAYRNMVTGGSASTDETTPK
jgi:hypothetical protein